MEERNKLKERIRVVEQQIRKHKQDKVDKEEEEAWMKMQENQKAFYGYACKKKRVHPYIGPFSKNGKVIKKKACEVLAQEFFQAFRTPTAEKK